MAIDSFQFAREISWQFSVGKKIVSNFKFSKMDFKELIVFKKAFAVSMQIFEITKSFPKEEKYALIDQIRRSSRSVCAQLAEASRKRMY
ncbi:MAG: hypothetical protein ACJAUV_001750 [Flavobacteriales bacterium]